MFYLIICVINIPAHIIGINVLEPVFHDLFVSKFALATPAFVLVISIFPTVDLSGNILKFVPLISGGSLHHHSIYHMADG